MSGLRDARVLQAFIQGVQRSYMLGVEQRLTSAESSVTDLLADTGSSELNYAYAESTSSFSTTSSGYVDVTGLSVDITTTGGPILVMACSSAFYVSSTTAGTGAFAFLFNGTDYRAWEHETAGNTYRTIYGLAPIRVFSAAAGAYTIKGRAKTNAGTAYVDATSQIIAIEL